MLDLATETLRGLGAEYQLRQLGPVEMMAAGRNRTSYRQRYFELISRRVEPRYRGWSLPLI
jgi:hypothetical protein